MAGRDKWITHRRGVTQDDVTGFLDDHALIGGFDLFRQCLAEAVGDGVTPDEIRVRSEVLVCGLNGIAQGLVTMSGYQWAAPDALVAGAVAGALAPANSP
ncbi:MAG: hypothetical protein R2715_17850 [Ilumatobacteraceae bacterium]